MDRCGGTAVHLAAMQGRTDTVKVLLESLAPDERLEYLKAQCGHGMTALHLAAWMGHTDTVKVLLESLAHDERLERLKAKNEDDMMAVHWAAEKGHTDTAKVLLESLEPDERLEYLKARDRWGKTALHWAAEKGHTDTVKVLLESLEPDGRLEYLKAKDERGMTAVHCAAWMGQTDTVKVLLESLAPDERPECLKAKEKHGVAGLHMAARWGRTDTVKVLLESLTHDEKQECLKAKDEDGMMAVYWAAMEGRTDTVKVLLESLAPDERLEYLKARDRWGMTALHWAAKKGHTDTVKVLLESLEPYGRLEYLKAKDERGMTAVHRAAMEGRTDTVKVLLESLAPDKRLECLKARDNRGITAVHWAAHNADIINYLIQSTKPEQRSQLLSNRNHDRDTPLMLMAKKNDSERISLVLKLLTLTQRFDCMKMRGKNGQTVLHALSANKQKADQSKLATVVSLTGRFAPELLKIKDSNGKTPADVAEARNIEGLLISRLKIYNLNKPPHVTIFYTTYNRPGALEEMNTLSDALKSIGLVPDICHDFSKVDVLAKIYNACSHSDLSGLIVFIMSHGDASSVRDNQNQPLDIQDIIVALGGGDGIPKALILQTCRYWAREPHLTLGPYQSGEQLASGFSAPSPGEISSNVPETNLTRCPLSDATASISGLSDAGVFSQRSETFHLIAQDVMVLCATLHGQPAERNYMIPILANHLERADSDDDFDTVVTMTSDKMGGEKGQVPERCTTMRRKFCIRHFAKDAMML